MAIGEASEYRDPRIVVTSVTVHEITVHDWTTCRKCGHDIELQVWPEYGFAGEGRAIEVTVEAADAEEPEATTAESEIWCEYCRGEADEFFDLVKKEGK